MRADVEKTKAYYAARSVKLTCDCVYCRNYLAQIQTAYPALTRYLDDLGVDVLKPHELMFLDADENGMVESCGCMYIVLGQCEDGFHDTIAGVEIRKVGAYPDTYAAEEHFVLTAGAVFLPCQISLHPV